MARSNDPDERVAAYWRRRYSEIDRKYAERDLAHANAMMRIQIGCPPPERTFSAPSDSASPAENHSKEMDFRTMCERKTNLLADISTCEYLLPSLRNRWYEQLNDIDLTAADADGALDSLSQEVIEYSAEYPYHLDGFRLSSAAVLRSSLVNLASGLTILAGQCHLYQHRYRSQREPAAGGLDKTQRVPLVHREIHPASQGATPETSSGLVSICMHCKRSAHLSQHNAQTWVQLVW